MSDSTATDHGDHGDHGPEPTELTHPLLWTVGLVVMSLLLVWLFFHFMHEGAQEVRDQLKVAQLPGVMASTTVDLTPYLNDTSPQCLALGKQVFDTNCASCHGMNGDTKGAQTPGARNFHVDPFRNPNGGGAYALYLVVSKGFGNGMPSFTGLDPVKRMFAIQYIRESFIKKYNPTNYVESDPPDLLAQMPKPGSGSEGTETPPNERPTPTTLLPLMQATASAASEQDADLEAWSDALPGAADRSGVSRADALHLQSLVIHHHALGARLERSAHSGDQQGFVDLLVGGTVPGVSASDFPVMAQDRLIALYQAARTAAEGSR